MSRKRGGTLLLVFGVLVAVGVAFMVFNQAKQAADTARMESVEVLVAGNTYDEAAALAAGHAADTGATLVPAFDHPFTGRRIELEEPLPEDLQQALEKLEG